MMGAKNVKAVYRSWRHLPDRPFRLLTFIAVTVLDSARPRCEMSREALAEGLGYESWDTAARNAVDRAVSSLRVAGALEVAQAPGRGRRAHYWLQLSGPVTGPTGDSTSPSDVQSDADSTSPSEVQSSKIAPRSDADSTSPTEVQTPADTVLLFSGTNYQEKDAAAAQPDPPPKLHAIIGGATMPRSRQPQQPGLWPAAVAEPVTDAGDTQSVTEPTTAQTIVAEWIDRCRKRPPGQVIGQVAKHIREMLAEGIDPDDVRRGTAAWMGKGLHPSTLPSVVNEVMNRGSAPPRPSTTDQRVAETLALGARLQAEADRLAIGQ